MKVTAIGIDLAKNVFQVHGVDEHGKVVCTNFSSGRQLAAWLGLVPRQRSSGGKSLLLGISKRGDCYLRTLLIHGARAVIRCAGRKKKDEVTATEVISTTQSRNWLQSVVS